LKEGGAAIMNIVLVGIAFVVFLVLIWIRNSIYIIKEWERGVVLRLGKLLPQAKSSGINFVFYPI
jgi:regulator of protease activity HflC (stomatin/prohibitin superfamily)